MTDSVMVLTLANSTPKSRVWIVDDDLEYAETVRYVLGHTSGIDTPEVFASFEALDRHIHSDEDDRHPDCILMDISLPGTSGINAVRRLKDLLPGVPIVMLTVNDGQETMRLALSAGASGYLMKDMPLDKIIDAIRLCREGGVLLPPGVADSVLGFLRSEKSPTDYGLTSREMELVRLMADGLAHKQIADVLKISQYTVENHCRNIYEKLQVHSGIQAISKAMKEGLV